LRLGAGSHCPFDLQRIVHVDVRVHHGRLLDVVVGEGAQDDIPGFAFVLFREFRMQVLAPDAADRQVDVAHAPVAALQQGR
jgi:hypothetical protein